MASPSALYPKKVSLTNCDKEPIHILGKVQSHGMLLVFDSSSLKLQRGSENVLSFFKIKQEFVGGYSFYDIFPEDGSYKLLKHINVKSSKPLEITIKNSPFVAIVHYKDNLVYIELENFEEDQDTQITQQDLSEIITDLSEASSVTDMCQKTAVLIKEKLDYDRVMLYQFDENWNGQIIAEANDPDMESWLGLHYPATDIPQQARALFLKQGVRIISDVNADTLKVIPQLDTNGEPLDLSRCELRAVSPIHIEYLQNMGVAATLTAAIISKGTLWGLIACHNYTPKFINYYKRLSVKFLTQVFSTQLTLRDSNEVLSKVNEAAQKRAVLVEQMSKNWNIHEGLTAHDHTMLDITEAGGGAIYVDGNLTSIGKTPENDEILELIDWIYKEKNQILYSTQHLGKEYERGIAFAKTASGVLCSFILKDSKDCLLWFKPETKETISWAGNPEKAVTEGEIRLSPRKSFEKWSQEQQHISRPWKDFEIASVKALNENISNIIISKYAEVKRLNEDLQIAYKELETFSYSVSHDLRAPLRGIDGFAQIIKEDYFDSLDEYGKSSIQRIIDATEKMNMLIDDILSFSSLGQEGISFVTLSLDDMVEEVLKFQQVDIVYPNTEIIVEEDLGEIYGDRAMIFQLLNNLISNALKYSQKSNNPLVEVGKAKEGPEDVYFVKDNGIGFNDAYKEKIFGIFNRLVKDREFEGSGIGLAIVQRIIDKHHGVIWTESEEGKGATFFFKVSPNP